MTADVEGARLAQIATLISRFTLFDAQQMRDACELDATIGKRWFYGSARQSGIQPGNVTACVTFLLAENAALRDRLARCEERERELREVLRDVGEEATTARAFGSNATLIRDQLYRIEDIVAESLATPTAPYDGAARMRELEENARAQHAELAESVATTNALIGEQMEIAKLLREIKYSAMAGAEGRNVTSYEAGLKDALRAAEAALRIVEDAPFTDGAARAGDATDNRGETNGE